MTTIRIIIVTLLLLIMSRASYGHGLPIRIKIDEASNQVLHAPFDGGHVSDDPVFGLSATLPGIGAQPLPNGLTMSEIVGLDVTQGLLYWDGLALAPTDAVLTVQSADFTDQYVIEADSPRQTALRWAEYDGTSHWHAHGIYFLSPSSANLGIYGLTVQLTVPGAIPSDPFLIPLIYDPDEQWTTAELADGIAALQSAMIVPSRGDYDRDWLVDAADFSLWKETYGKTMSPFLSADGNGDGRVSAADFTVWRDNLGASTFSPASGSGQLAVPETPSWVLLVMALPASMPRRIRSIFVPAKHKQVIGLPNVCAILVWHLWPALPLRRRHTHEEKITPAGDRIVSSSDGRSPRRQVRGHRVPGCRLGRRSLQTS